MSRKDAPEPLFQGCYVIESRRRTVPMSRILVILPRPAYFVVGNFEAAHVSRLHSVLKSPQCFARGPISKSLAEIALHLRRGLAYDAHLLACSTILRFPRLGRILASLLKQLTRRDLCYQASLLDIEKHP